MSYVKMSWSIPLEKNVLPMLKDLPEDLRAYIADEFEDMTDEITSWLQQNAPWQDQTTNARKSLRAEVEVAMLHIARIKMSYGEEISYSQYLESMQGGRFSILTPALAYWYPILVDRVQQALRGYRPRSRRLVARRVR